LAISDLFTEKAQFQWMLATCLELGKHHPLEDEILHQYLVFGACKAAAVLGPVSFSVQLLCLRKNAGSQSDEICRGVQKSHNEEHHIILSYIIRAIKPKRVRWTENEV
jgi:huntingtin